MVTSRLVFALFLSSSPLLALACDESSGTTPALPRDEASAPSPSAAILDGAPDGQGAGGDATVSRDGDARPTADTAGPDEAGPDEDARDGAWDAAELDAADDAVGDSGDARDEDALGVGALRFVNTQARPLDIYVSGEATPLATGLGYAAATTTIHRRAGTVRLVARAAGSPPTAAPLLSSDPIAVSASTPLTLAVTGAGAADGGSALVLRVFADAFGVAAAGKARLVVVNAQQAGDAVGVDLGADGTIEADGIAPLSSSALVGIDAPAAADVRLRVLRTAAGGATRDGLASFALPLDAAAPGSFVFLLGDPRVAPRAPSGLRALVVRPADATAALKPLPTVYLLNAVPDVAQLAVAIAGAAAPGGVGFGELARVDLAASPATLTFTTTSSVAPISVGSASTGALAVGERYLAVATGFHAPFAGQAAFALGVYREQFDDAPASALLRAVHASGDAPTIEIGTAPRLNGFQPITGLGALTFLQSSDEPGAAWSPAVALNPSLRTTDDTFSFTAPPPASARRYFEVAAGAYYPANDTQTDMRLILVDAAPTGRWAASTVERDP